MSEIDFVPNFIYKSTTGEISNSKSVFLQYNELSFVSFDKSVNIWNFRTKQLLHSIRHKKYLVSCFTIKNNLLFIGYGSGLIRVFKINDDFELVIEYRIHIKRLLNIFYDNGFIISVSSDGLIIKYDLVSEKYEKIIQTNPVDVFDYKNGIIVVGTTDSTLILIKNDKEYNVILNNRLKYIFIIDENVVLIVFRDNNIKFYDFDNEKYIDCKKIKKLRSIKRYDDKIFILSDKKIYSYLINKFNLVLHLENDINDNFVDFDLISDDFGYISKDNSFCTNKMKIEYHKNEINRIFKDPNSRICSFSTDKLIIWNINENSLIFYNSIYVEYGISFIVFCNWYVIGTRHEILFYNINDLKIFKTYKLKESGTVNLSMAINENTKDKIEDFNNFLVIAINQKVFFYNKNLEIYDTLELQDYVSSIKIYNEMIFIGQLNSKVFIYNLEKELIKTLYGHSLPVVNIIVTDKLVYTIGLDKMLKIWGLDFGDCRKSIIINESKNVIIVCENLFLVSSNILKYYNVFKIYYEKKYIDSNLLFLDNEFLIGAGENSLHFFEIDKYELDKIDEDSDDFDAMEINTNTVVSITKYEEFLNILEEGNIELTEYLIDKFDRFLREINLGDLDSYLLLLSASQIDVLINLLTKNDNLIVVSRIFIVLMKIHKDVITGNIKCNELRLKLIKKIGDFRDSLGKNTYKIILKTNMLD